MGAFPAGAAAQEVWLALPQQAAAAVVVVAVAVATAALVAMVGAGAAAAAVEALFSGGRLRLCLRSTACKVIGQLEKASRLSSHCE